MSHVDEQMLESLCKSSERGDLLTAYPVIRANETVLVPVDELTDAETDAITSWLRGKAEEQANKAATLREYLARRSGRNVIGFPPKRDSE